MKLQKGATEIELALIKIVALDRQRQHKRDSQGRLTEVEDLQLSIAKRGMLNPVIVEACDEAPFKFVLKAGERRLTACQNLGHQKILARKASDLSPVEAQIIELEENIKRSDLEWQDLVRGVARIHQLYCTEASGDWTLGETAAECGLSIGIVSMYISVFNEMSEERVSKAGSVREAYNMLQRRSQRQAGVALMELLETPDAPAPAAVREDLSEEEEQEVKALTELRQTLPARLTQPPPKPAVVAVIPPESIIQSSFLEWAPQYTGPKFNFLHCDFPYGIEVFSGPQGRGAELGQEGRVGYGDSADTYQGLLSSLCLNLDRFLSVSAHMMFWLSADIEIISATVRYFNQHAPSLSFHKFPLIWHKSDNAGIASDPRHGPRHVYETCLLASRGQRQIARVKGDSYAAPTDKKLHPSTKPEPMLRFFMEMLVDETTSMLDPTCGSAASLRAAESLGANRVLGLEIDRQYVEPARLALKQARAKRAAERIGEL